jgi:protein-disulfide isomerase
VKPSTVAIGAILAAAGGFFVGQVASRRSAAPADDAPAPNVEAEGPDPSKRYRVIVGRSPQRGDEGALVTIISFVDYAIETPAKTQSVLDRVAKRYGQKVRLVYKMNPDANHAGAMGAAEAVLAAAAQERFWEMHQRLLRSRTKLSRPDLEAHARAIGLDLEKFRAALDSHEHARIVQSDMRSAARFGVRGGSHLFVNGFPVAGDATEDALRRIVDREIPGAQRLLSTGVPPDRLHSTLLRDALRGLGDQAPAQAERPPVRPQVVEDPNAVYKVPIEGAPARGPATALVTIVEFTDFQ